MSQTRTVCLLTDEGVHAVVVESRGRRRGIVARGEAALRLPDSLLVNCNGGALAAAIVQAIRQTGMDPDSVILLVPLQWCFTQVLSTNGKRANAERLFYAFEPFLPLPLEEVTCVFQRMGGNRVLAVAVPTAPMTELLAALLNEGVDVSHIGVDALTAARDPDTDDGCTGAVLLDARWGRMAVDPERADNLATAVFATNNGCNLGAALASQINRLRPGDDPDRTWSVLDLTGRASLGTLDEPAADGIRIAGALSKDEAVQRLALAAAADPEILDLRTGPLAGRGLGAEIVRLTGHCLAAAMILILAATAGMHLHTRALRHNLAAVDRGRLEIYRQVFDVGALPPGAAMRLASQRLRLEGLTRPSGDAAVETDPETTSSLDLLRDVVARLPDDVRIMLTEARMEGGQLILRGQTAEHGDAEQIVEAIRAVPGLQGRPPRTSRVATGGVEFSITAGISHGQ